VRCASRFHPWYVSVKSVVDWHRSKSELGFKEQYEVNKWTLMARGDILLLYTDGLQEHKRGDDPISLIVWRIPFVERNISPQPASSTSVLNDLRTFANLPTM